MGDWKFIHFWEDDKIELYNLKEVIGEKNNLSEKFPEKVEVLMEKLQQTIEDSNSSLPTLNK